MKRNQEYEQEINLKDLFFHIAACWRSIIAFAIAGAVLFGGFRFVQYSFYIHSDKFAKDQETYQENRNTYEQLIEGYEDSIDSYEIQVARLTTYREESIKIRIDSHNEWVARKDYVIEVDPQVLAALPESFSQDPTDVLITTYQDSVIAAISKEETKDYLGIYEEKYIRELIAVTGDNESNTLSLEVIGNSQEQVQSIMEYCAEYLETDSKMQADKVEKHDLTVVNDLIYTRIDSPLSEEKKRLNDAIIDFNNKLTKAKADLAKFKSQGSPQMPQKQLKKYIAAGFLAGAVFTTGFYMILYLVDGKLHYTDELAMQYDLPICSELPHRFTRKPEKGIDRWLEQLYNSGRQTDLQVRCAQLATLLKGKFEGGSVMLASTASSNQTEQMYSKLSELLGNEVQITLVQDCMSKPDTFSLARAADAVIVTEVRDVSKRSEIRRLLETMRIAQCNLIGCIII